MHRFMHKHADKNAQTHKNTPLGLGELTLADQSGKAEGAEGLVT